VGQFAPIPPEGTLAVLLFLRYHRREGAVFLRLVHGGNRGPRPWAGERGEGKDPRGQVVKKDQPGRLGIEEKAASALQTDPLPARDHPLIFRTLALTGEGRAPLS